MFGKHRQLDKTYPPLITKMNFFTIVVLTTLKTKLDKQKCYAKLKATIMFFPLLLKKVC